MFCKVKSNFWNHQIFVQLFLFFCFFASNFLSFDLLEIFISRKRVQRYGVFLKPPNISATFFNKNFTFSPALIALHCISENYPTCIFYKFPAQILSIQNQSPKLQTYNNPTLPAVFGIHRTIYIEKIAGFHISKPCETNNRNQLKVHCLPAHSY